MYAAYDSYIEPKEQYLPRPQGNESLYEYLLECHRRISRDIGDYTAFVTPNTLTETPMSVLLRDIERLAAYLAAQGLRKGDVVTALLPTCAHVFPVLFAANKLGLIVSFLSPLTPPDALPAAMRHTKSRLLFLHDTISGRFGAAMAQYPCVVCRTSDYGADRALAGARQKEENNVCVPDVPVTFYRDALAQTLPPAETVRHFGKEAAVYLQDGGATGKTIVFSSFAFNAGSYKFYLMDIPHNYQTGYALSALPCFRAFGLGGGLLYTVYNAYRPILIAECNAERVNDLIRQLPVTEIFGEPDIFRALMEAPNFENEGLKNLKTVISGGEPVDDAIIRQFDETLAKFGSAARLCRCYGPAEMAAAATSCCWQHFNPRSVGYPLPGVEVQILDENRNELPAGEIGEIVLAGDNMMNGYLPDETARTCGACPDEAGNTRLYSGDRGYLDKDGFLFLAGGKPA